ALGGVVWALVVAVLAFALTSPYAILDWSSFIQATLVEQGRMVRGVADFPFTRQYRGTMPYLYFLEQQLAWGMWWPLGLTALAGGLAAFAYMLITLGRGGRALVGRRVMALSDLALGNLIIWAWVLPYFGITGAFLAKFNRYMSPLLPFAAIFAAGLLWALWQVGRGPHTVSAPRSAAPWAEFDVRPLKRRAWWRGVFSVVAGGLAVLTLLASVYWSVAYVNGVYGREHTWITASRWIYANVPSGSAILWELWDDPLPVRALPDDPQTNLGSAGLRNIDWGPYEEDTAEKYAILRERLREADYVAYSSKRIYGSVDNLPQRYPMTLRYYAGMWDGSLGFEVVADVTAPPRLFGREFDDRDADESWSLYDHPRVTIFRKVRSLSDAEFDAYFARAWEDAVPYYRGEDSFLSPFLELMGLGQSPQAEGAGLIGRVIGLLSGEGSRLTAPTPVPDLLLDRPLAALPVVDNYRWNDWASGTPWAAALVWWSVLWLMGLIAWPLTFRIFSRLRDRGYLLARSLGWLLTGWLLWLGASVQLWHNSVRNAWLIVGACAVIGLALAWRQRVAMLAFLRHRWQVLVVGEVVFAVAFVLFVQIRIFNPDLWQPWRGGEKFMEFAFLNGILRSPTFPPVNPHFAGGYINYYYYGLYLVAHLTKLTGIYAEVAFNLAVASLFALTALNAFTVAYSTVAYSTVAIAKAAGQRALDFPVWRAGLRRAGLAALFVVGIGNLDGFAELLRNADRVAPIAATQGILGIPALVVGGLARWVQLVLQGGPIPAYDFWPPSRVIPNTINEFPYWTFLFADLHPHMIAIPFSLLVVAGVLNLLRGGAGALARPTLALSAVTFAFVIGALAAINLWEYPTYLGLVLLVCLILTLAGRLGLGWALLVWISTAGLSYLFYLPFFANYAGVGAAGIGRVRAPDDLGPWLLIWGFFVFVLLSWLVWQVRQPVPRALGISRAVSLILRHFDRLPRVLRLMQQLLRAPTFGFLAGATTLFVVVMLIVLAAGLGHWILALSLVGVGLAMPLLLRANLPHAMPTVMVASLAFTGFLILAGTQIVFVRDFLQGGDWYRMNTLFKFYVQVWVLLGLAAAIAFAQLWRATAQQPHDSLLPLESPHGESPHIEQTQSAFAALAVPVGGARLWRTVALGLLLCSLAFPLFGTPDRLDYRMVGWRPPVGTLDGMAYMEQGSYTWPDDSHRIELRHDHAVIQWLLEHVRGNLVIAESAEVDYYQAGGTRIASFTGLSGLMGKHENEQRGGAQVAERHAFMREFWNTSDVERTLAIARELDVALVYVGQLERHQHPAGVEKFHAMAEMGLLEELYATDVIDGEGSILYAFPNRIRATEDGYFVPVPAQDTQENDGRPTDGSPADGNPNNVNPADGEPTEGDEDVG
ncbi:MAG: DUF2298 domain-containing protein, partial [Litorilinea sp.]